MNIVQEGALEDVETSNDRRAGRRDKLIACAETAIAQGGLSSLRARDLSRCAGCAVGAIYNHVEDLDELVMLVGQRTMAALSARLDRATAAPRRPAAHGPEHLLVAWADAYRAFAAENRNLWRALFEFRLPPGRDLSEGFVADQMRLFVRLEETLGALQPRLDAEARQLRARTLFSAVHGIVALGLEEKLVAMPLVTLDGELRAFVEAYLAGLRQSSPD